MKPFIQHLLLLAAMALTPACMSAQFRVHALTGTVSLERNGQKTTASLNADCNNSDVFIIGPNSSISVLNRTTKKIYKANGPATLQVYQIVAQAESSASNHLANVLDNVSLRRSKAASAVYEQNGMVRRSQAVLDSVAAMVIPPKELAIFILNSLNSPMEPSSSLSVTTEPEKVLSFCAKSTEESPIYFNVVKLRYADGKFTSTDISELGQPITPYVLQPGQELTREQDTLAPGELHLLVATPFGFDVDALLDEMDELMESGAEIPASNPELKALVFPLNQI